MRIIAGKAKGRKLNAVPGKETRPLTDRVKESLFSILQPEMEGAAVLDLYCGSGAFGIEAVSRGAVRAVCIEKGRAAAEVCRQNIQTIGFASQAVLVQADVVSWCKAAQSSTQKFDIIFADPPFLELAEHDSAFQKLRELLAPLCAPEGQIVVRTHERAATPDIPGAALFRTKEIGISTLHFYRPVGALS